MKINQEGRETKNPSPDIEALERKKILACKSIQSQPKVIIWKRLIVL